MLKVINKAQATQVGARYSDTGPIAARPKAEPPRPPDHGAEIRRALEAIESLCDTLCSMQAAHGKDILQAVERFGASGIAASQASAQTVAKLLRGMADREKQGSLPFRGMSTDTKKSVRFTVTRRDEKNRVVEFTADESPAEDEVEIVVAPQH